MVFICFQFFGIIYFCTLEMDGKCRNKKTHCLFKKINKKKMREKTGTQNAAHKIQCILYVPFRKSAHKLFCFSENGRQISTLCIVIVKVYFYNNWLGVFWSHSIFISAGQPIDNIIIALSYFCCCCFVCTFKANYFVWLFLIQDFTMPMHNMLCADSQFVGIVTLLFSI